MIKWTQNTKLQPQIILDKLETLTVLNKDGTVSFKGFETEDALAALYNMIHFPSHFVNLQNESFLFRSISNVAKIEKLNKNNVINELNKLVKIELAKKEEKYTLLTSISLSSPAPLIKITFQNITIEMLNKGFQKKYNSRATICKNMTYQLPPNIDATPNDYFKVKISIKERHYEVATKKCLDALDLYRAILALMLNPKLGLFFTNEWYPINVIRLGGIHTLHTEEGKIVNQDIYWFEPSFMHATPYKIEKDYLGTLAKNIRWVYRKIRILKYSLKMQDILIRFVRALDESDQHITLIKLWSVLETICSSQDTNNDSIPKRCSFIYSTEREYHKQILEHLREYRNNTVHRGTQKDRIKIYCFQLQRYLHDLILFHLLNANTFNSLEEINQFLDLPNDLSVLKRKNNLITKAMKYIKS